MEIRFSLGEYPLVRNGFTLIELLAVIIILGIIALIATPIILGVINDAKDEAAKTFIETSLAGKTATVTIAF